MYLILTCAEEMMLTLHAIDTTKKFTAVIIFILKSIKYYLNYLFPYKKVDSSSKEGAL